MEISDLILADYAAANEGGKFTLVGAGFTKINTKKIPCIHPMMFLMVRLKVTMADKGRNKVDIKIVGNKGIIFRAECDVDVSDNHKEEEHLPLPIRINNLKFEHAGEYTIDVKINGQPKADQTLTIVHLNQPVGK